MTSDTTYPPTLQQEAPKKETLRLLMEDIKPALLFLLSLALLGLSFPPAYVFVVVVLITSFTHNRYDFLIQLTLFFGEYGFFDTNVAFYNYRVSDVALLLSVIAIVLCRLNKSESKLLFATLGYIFALLVFAAISDESLRIQLYFMRKYWIIIYFMVPLLVFANQTFDIKIFFRKLMTYALIIAVFYILDSFIFGGSVLVPYTYSWTSTYPTYYHFYCEPGSFPRKYPPGLFPLALCIFPVLKMFKLKTSHIVILLLAFAACRTMSVIVGLVITLLCFAGNIKRFLKYILIAGVLFFSAYHLDRYLDGQLRIEQFVDQFKALSNPEDIETLSEFGTGRMAQAIPKIDLLYSMNRQYVGFGFLSSDKSTNPKFTVVNDLYSYEVDEIATNVEVTQIQTFLDIGFIGLALQTFFYLAIYFWLLRPMPYSISYIITLVCISLFGVGGFAGLTSPHGLLLLGLNIGVILLVNRQKQTEASPQLPEQ